MSDIPHIDGPLVTIVCPCFNQERFIAQAIASVRAQTERCWELIVVDDGSSDRSVSTATAAAQGDPRVHVIGASHGGVSCARNKGSAMASLGSQYLLFLDGDDELDPPMLARMVRELECDSAISMVHSRVTFIDERGQALRGTPGMRPRYVADRWGVRELADSELETPFASILALAGIIPSCAMIRRDAFIAVGGWDESFGQGFEDTDMFLRLALRGRVHQVPERLVRHRRYTGQSSQQPGRHDAQIVKLHARWRDTSRLSQEQQVVVGRAWSFIDRQLNWRTAWTAARRSLAEGRPVLAVRFIVGSLLITARSVRPLPRR